MWQVPYRKRDLEAGATPLYPTMLESPELRWSFIRKVYSILTFQLLLTVAVSAVVVKVRPIAVFFATTPDGLALYILLLVTPFIMLYPLSYYHQKHPVNYILLGLFTICISSAIGLTSAFTDGKPFSPPASSLSSSYEKPSSFDLSKFDRTELYDIEPTWGVKVGGNYRRKMMERLHWDAISLKLIKLGRVILEAAILTTGVAVGLTLYTFWATKRGYDFNFLGPFLSAAIFVVILFCLLQIFLPLGKISHMVYGCIAAIVFCGYIIYDTDNLIKRYSYDEYIWASVALYLDIINLFLSLLMIFRAADR